MAARIETLVIHLARATGRRTQVEALLAGTPYPARILDAVDGAAVAEDVRAAVMSGRVLFAPTYPFALSAGEYGCFMSHRAAWAAILEEGLDAALILEDDVALVEGFGAAVDLAARHVERLGYVQFQVRAVEGGVPVAEADGMAIVRPNVTPLRTSAQMVSRGAAERLLKLTERFDRPVDTFLQSHWHTGLHLACVVPSGVEDRTAQTGGSTISSKRSFWAKVAREWKRSRYRAAVKRLS